MRSVHARNPYTSLWREVSRFSGGDAADRLMLHAGADSRNVDQFRRAVSLADEYWVAYEDSSETIDTVPLYYGALSLGNALAYATLSSARVAERTPGHGLSIDFDIRKKNSVLSTNVSFQQSTDAFGIINEALGGDTLNGKTFKILDLLQMIPEISDRLEHFGTTTAYEVTFSPGPRKNADESYAGDVIARVRSRHGASISLSYVRDNLAIADYLQSANLQIEGDSLKWTTSRAALIEFDNIAIKARGSWWLLPKIGAKLVPEYCIYLAILHTLSVFARYVPNYWLKIQEEHGDEWVLLRDFISIAEETVPRLALNHFARSSHQFPSP